MTFHKTIKNILLDIEGTTSSISFVHEVLFPYAKKHLESFVRQNFDQDKVREILESTLKINKIEAKNQDELIELSCKQLQQWIAEDKKIKELKDLQGLIWEAGYKSGEYHGHLYEDAYFKLKEWKEQDYKLYIYSSGSVKAQKLLFGHTEFGDLNHLFTANFDTKIGSKKEAQSYTNITNELKISPDTILFLSDNEEELRAAQEAGMQVIQLARPQDRTEVSKLFDSVENFSVL